MGTSNMPLPVFCISHKVDFKFIFDFCISIWMPGFLEMNKNMENKGSNISVSAWNSGCALGSRKIFAVSWCVLHPLSALFLTVWQPVTASLLGWDVLNSASQVWCWSVFLDSLWLQRRLKKKCIMIWLKAQSCCRTSPSSMTWFFLCSRKAQPLQCTEVYR